MAKEKTTTKATDGKEDPLAEIGALLRQGTTDLKNQFIQAGRRNEKEVLYSTLEDFGRVDPGLKRLVVIGCTGAGKSTINNIMAGWKFVQRASEDFAFSWEAPKASGGSSEADATADPAQKPMPLFESGAGSDSVTKQTAYANLDWFGDSVRCREPEFKRVLPRGGVWGARVG